MSVRGLRGWYHSEQCCGLTLIGKGDRFIALIERARAQCVPEQGESWRTATGETP